MNRWGRWFSWPAVIIANFLPIPSAIIYAMAGWTGMSWVTFLVLDVIGTLSWAGLLAGLGYALGQHAVSVAEEVFEIWALGHNRGRGSCGGGTNQGRADAKVACTCILVVQLALQVHALMRQDGCCVNHPDDARRTSGS